MNTYKHFKLYKAGKKWCLMAVTIIAATMGAVASGEADSSTPADITDTNFTVQVDNKDNTDINNSPTATADSAQTKNVSTQQIQAETVDTKDNVQQSLTSDQPAPTPVGVQSSTVKNGWQNENNQWVYYINGHTSEGRTYSYLPTINGSGDNWYLVDNGVAQSGVQQWAGTYYDFDATTYLKVTNNYVQSQWGDWYMFTGDGSIASRVYQWAGTYYYFDPITYLRVDNDYRQSQWGDWYMFGGDGRIASQVYQWAGTYYYFDPTTHLRVDNDYRQSQWGDWYMFGGDGRIVSGFANWYGSLYFFDPTTYLKLTNTYFNGNGYWNNWDTYWADYSGVVHGVHYFSQFTPVWAGWGCAGASLTMLLSIHNIWPGVGTVIGGIPQGGNGGQIGNPYTGAGFGRVIQPNALAAYGRRWYGGVSDSSGATISQIVNSVLNGHPVLYYGWSPYDAGGVRNHCKIILGYNRNNGLFHVYDPCYGNGGWGAYSEGRTAYDRGWNSWITWNQLASEYAGQALTIY